MADSSVSVLDSSGTPRAVDAQTIGTDFQQTVTIGDGTNAGRVAAVDSSGRLQTKGSLTQSATGTITSVSGATSSTTLLASNTSRLDAAIFNDSTAVLYVAMAGTASTTSYTVQIPAGGYWELPNRVIYTGIITGIWASAIGAARITEYT